MQDNQKNYSNNPNYYDNKERRTRGVHSRDKSNYYENKENSSDSHEDYHHSSHHHHHRYQNQDSSSSSSHRYHPYKDDRSQHRHHRSHSEDYEQSSSPAANEEKIQTSEKKETIPANSVPPTIPTIDAESFKNSFVQNPEKFDPIPQRNDKNAKKKKNAYIFLVLKGEKYIKGALIGAFSLRLTKSTKDCDVICMITHDVKNTPGFNSLLTTHYFEENSDQTSTSPLIKPLFDEVYEIPYITHPTKPLVGENQKEMYGSWMDVSFTKWNCLQLEEYDKILFLDSDICVVKNIEHLFELVPPAATFSRRNAQPFLETGMENPFLVPKYYGDGDDDFVLEQPKHGDVVHAGSIEYSIDAGLFVGVGTTVLLKPSKAKFAKYLQSVFKDPIFNEAKPSSMSGADEVSICQFFGLLDKEQDEEKPKSEWKYISQIYNYIWNGSSGNDWLKGTGFAAKDICIRHLFGLKKPWQMWSEKEKTWEDVKSWWEAQRILFEQDIPQNKEMKGWWAAEEEQAKKEEHLIPKMSSSFKRKPNEQLKAQASYSNYSRGKRY